MHTEMSSPTPLSVQLPESTRAQHHKVEQTRFIQRLFRGSFSLDEYRLYLESLLQIYSVLEDQLEKRKEHEICGLVYFPELFRTDSLRKDIKMLKNENSCKNQQLESSVEDYTTHLLKLAETCPELLIAHAYVRIMGDLSGGRILAKRLNPRLGDATHFYHYEQIHIGDTKKTFRERLDRVKLPLLQEAICEEAQSAFDYHIKIFEGIQANHGIDKTNVH